MVQVRLQLPEAGSLEDLSIDLSPYPQRLRLELIHLQAHLEITLPVLYFPDSLRARFEAATGTFSVTAQVEKLPLAVLISHEEEGRRRDEKMQLA